MGTGFWIILAVLAVLLLATGKTKNNGKSQGGTKGTASRIDHGPGSGPAFSRARARAKIAVDLPARI